MLLHESATMEQSAPENLSTHVFNDCEISACHNPLDGEQCSPSDSDLPVKETAPASVTPTALSHTSNTNNNKNNSNSSSSSATKVKLSFSVDRLLSAERSDPQPMSNPIPSRQCCDGNVYACCTFSSCFGQNPTTTQGAKHSANLNGYSFAGLDKFYPGIYMDYKSVLRPTPIRPAEHATTFPSLATNALMRFHQQQQQQQQQQQKASTLLHGSASAAAAAALLAPLSSLKTLQLTQQQRFLAKAQAQQQLLDMPAAAAAAPGNSNSNNNSSSSSSNSNNNNNSASSNNSHNNNGKRKRSWSRAVFTNLQRKGLEIQFQQQKYITKPDRRKLAARLNLTDAQVKVWFQNRRMKWRHTRENLKSGHEKQPPQSQSQSQSQSQQPPLNCSNSNSRATPLLLQSPTGTAVGHEVLDYSSDSCSSLELSERADDDDNIEIDVVE